VVDINSYRLCAFLVTYVVKFCVFDVVRVSWDLGRRMDTPLPLTLGHAGYSFNICTVDRYIHYRTVEIALLPGSCGNINAHQNNICAYVCALHVGHGHVGTQAYR
jgi:hypothetical protein